MKTRQGFIPSQAKPNQDSFISVKNLGGIDGLWMFGVCDGHGINGHLVSDFVKKNLPRILGAMFVQVLSSGFKKVSKPKKGKAVLIHKEDVILPPLVKKSNFQSFHNNQDGQQQHYSGDESGNESHEMRRGGRSESIVPSMEEMQQQEERE